ncbi:MAG: hypothetical protein WD294_13640 [Phycisphaeraceae bacterium]
MPAEDLPDIESQLDALLDDEADADDAGAPSPADFEAPDPEPYFAPAPAAASPPPAVPEADPEGTQQESERFDPPEADEIDQEFEAGVDDDTDLSEAIDDMIAEGESVAYEAPPAPPEAPEPFAPPESAQASAPSQPAPPPSADPAGLADPEAAISDGDAVGGEEAVEGDFDTVDDVIASSPADDAASDDLESPAAPAASATEPEEPLAGVSDPPPLPPADPETAAGAAELPLAATSPTATEAVDPSDDEPTEEEPSALDDALADPDDEILGDMQSVDQAIDEMVDEELAATAAAADPEPHAAAEKPASPEPPENVSFPASSDPDIFDPGDLDFEDPDASHPAARPEGSASAVADELDADEAQQRDDEPSAEDDPKPAAARSAGKSVDTEADAPAASSLAARLNPLALMLKVLAAINRPMLYLAPQTRDLCGFIGVKTFFISLGLLAYSVWGLTIATFATCLVLATLTLWCFYLLFIRARAAANS